MPHPSSSHRLTATTIITGLGILSLAPTIQHVAFGQSIETLLFGILFPAAASTALIAAGAWMYRSDLPDAETRRVAAWTSLGAIIGIIFGYPVVPYQAAQGITLTDIPNLVTNWATTSALMGVIVGVYDARRHESQAALEAERNKLVQREHELEQQNARLETLTEVVSHDLRNPLNVAIARVELAHQEYDDGLSDALDALDRIEVLIEDTLRLARFGDPVVEPDRVTLQAVAEQSWAVVDTSSADLTIADDVAFRADADRAQHIFENLFRNAVEHSGASVTVEVGALDDNTAEGFYVADDGAGIPEADRDKVFQYGYTTSNNGTGFGLNIVQEVSGAHGWDVAVTESDAGGARFEFRGVDTV